MLNLIMLRSCSGIKWAVPFLIAVGGWFQLATAQSTNLPERGTSTGSPYISSDDDFFLDKSVTLECVDGSELDQEPVSFLFTPAHQPDYPVRPFSFGATNNKFSAGDKRGAVADFLGKSVIKLGETPVQIDKSLNELLLSALLYIVFKDEDDSLTPIPVVPYLNTPFYEMETPNEWTKAMLDYRLDCELFDLNSYDPVENRTIVYPPLGRSDFYPSFKISYGADDKSNMEKRVVQLISRHQDARSINDFLFRGRDFVSAVRPESDFLGKDYRHYIKKYFDGDEKNEPHFISKFVEDVSISFYKADISFKLSPQPDLETEDSTNSIVIKLTGTAFEQLAQEDLSGFLRFEPEQCNVAKQDDLEDGFAIYAANCVTPPTALHLVPDGPEDLRGLILQENIGDRTARLDINSAFVEISLVTLEGRLPEGGVAPLTDFFPDRDTQYVTLDELSAFLKNQFECDPNWRLDYRQVLDRVIDLPTPCPSTKIWTLRFPEELTGDFSPVVSGPCEILGEGPELVNDKYIFKCDVPNDVEETSFTLQAAYGFDPIEIRAFNEQTDVELDYILRNLRVSRTFAQTVVEQVTAEMNTNSTPAISAVQYFLGEKVCGKKTDLVGDHPFPLVDATGCSFIPDGVKFDVGAKEANEAAEGAHITRRTNLAPLYGAPQVAQIPSFWRDLSVRLEDMQDMVAILGGFDAELQNGRGTGWRLVLYSDADCKNVIAPVLPEASDRSNAETPTFTWPLYANVRWYESNSDFRIRGECAAAQIKAPDDDGIGSAFFELDILPLITGRGVLLLAVSSDLAENGRRGVINESLIEWGEEIQQRELLGTEVEIWDVTSIGQVVKRTSATQLLSDQTDLRNLVNFEIERASPTIPPLLLAERNAKLSTATNGVVIIFDGAGYDENIENIFARFQSKRTVAKPEDLRLIVVEGCERWTEFAATSIQENCKEMGALSRDELKSLFKETFASLLEKGDQR